jgi:hypothetical protein
MFEQAMKLYGIDLGKELVINKLFKNIYKLFENLHFVHIYKVYGGKSLLDVPFSTSNINLFDTKLLDLLFTKCEQANGTIEPIKSSTPSLDKERVDLIKSIIFIIFYYYRHNQSLRIIYYNL